VLERLALFLGIVASLIAIISYRVSPTFKAKARMVWDFATVEHKDGFFAALLVVSVAAIAIAVKLAVALRESRSQLVEPRESDWALLKELLDVLPSNSGPIGYLRQASMESFIENLSDQLHAFAADWDNAEHQFHDSEVENGRVSLVEAVWGLLLVMGEVTWSLGNNRQGVPPEWKYGVRHEDYVSAVGRLSEAAARVVEAHQAVISVGRKKLNR
jgi:hypothetical protein